MKPSDKSALWPALCGQARRVARACSEEGNALYEFAMVLPMLSMLLVGIIFGGITFFDYVELTDAVAAGARTLANGRSSPSTACALAKTVITQSAGTLSPGLIITSCVSTVAQGSAGTVSATYPCNLPIPFTGINLCPVPGTNPTTGVTNQSCPTLYCISASTTVYIE